MAHGHGTDNLEQELRQLVMETRQGNKASYQSLLEKLTPFIRRAAAGQLARYNRQNMAEDITQESLLAIHLKLHTYDARLPFLAWVRAVVKHKLVDHLRKARVPLVSIDEQEFWEPADTANPEAPAIHHDLQTLLHRLKPPAGDIIYAMKVEGATANDLARKYGMTEGNVKVIAHRGLQKLSALVAQRKTA